METNRLAEYYRENPLAAIYQNKDKLFRDMDYLQQMYPYEAKKYQKKVNDVLDGMDYRESLIYDEYPDRMSIYKLAHDITQRIRVEEAVEGASTKRKLPSVLSGGPEGCPMRKASESLPPEDMGVSFGEIEVDSLPLPDKAAVSGQEEKPWEKLESPEKWKWVENLVQIILVYEILRRRHQTKHRIVRIY